MTDANPTSMISWPKQTNLDSSMAIFDVDGFDYGRCDNASALSVNAAREGVVHVNQCNADDDKDRSSDAEDDSVFTHNDNDDKEDDDYFERSQFFSDKNDHPNSFGNNDNYSKVVKA